MSAHIRTSDAERESAVVALGAHLDAGRLSLVAYESRMACVSAAETRGDLEALFGDLPEPHPDLSAAVPVPGAETGRTFRPGPGPGGVLGIGAMLVGLPGTVVYGFTTDVWWWTIPMIMVIAVGLWADDVRDAHRDA